jgi:hypothetical protein
MNYYTQVLLNNNSKVMVTWIPSGYAQVGRNLKLKKEDNTWETGWKVMEVYTIKSSKDLDLLNTVLREFRMMLGK